MGDMLSQEEINALLRGMEEEEASIDSGTIELSEADKDAIGEISNISMGTAATTLFALVNHKVVITTPEVSVVTWDDIKRTYEKPCVAIQIVYKEGLDGTNLLVLKESDVKVITDLMMGGDGTNQDMELTELHLSAISEAMNQMIGSAATSMSSMFNKKIDIAPPSSNHLDLTESFDQTELAEFLAHDFIKVAFRLQIGDLVDSEMMQLYPMEFARDIMENFNSKKEEKVEVPREKAPAASKQTQASAPSMNANQAGMGMDQMNQNGQGYMNQPAANMGYGMGGQMGNPMGNPMGGQMGNQMGNPMYNPMGGQDMYQQVPPNMGQGMPGGQQMYGNYNMNYNRNIEVQPAQFQNFDMGTFVQQKENIELIMDVPLEITVELGRTHKTIQDILDFSPGTIIELNKLAGEPIDVLVNGKVVAKGEVVVIDENFSIRITEIIKQGVQIF